jgi:hypothetical protein
MPTEKVIRTLFMNMTASPRRREQVRFQTWIWFGTSEIKDLVHADWTTRANIPPVGKRLPATEQSAQNGREIRIR